MTGQTLGIRLPDNLVQPIWDYQESRRLTRNAAIIELITKGLESSNATIPSEAAQDRETGAAARRWALEMSPKIARCIGAKSESATASEYSDFHGIHFSIRCAKPKTTYIGLYNTMRDRIAYVIGAFEQDNGDFELYKLTIAKWKELAREASSGNPNRGKLTMVSRGDCKKFGSLELTISSKFVQPVISE